MSDSRVNLQLGFDRKRRLSQMASEARQSPSEWLRSAVDAAWGDRSRRRQGRHVGEFVVTATNWNKPTPEP